MQCLIRPFSYLAGADIPRVLRRSRALLRVVVLGMLAVLLFDIITHHVPFTANISQEC